MIGGVDGDGAQGIIRIHTSFHSHACVKGQIMQRGNRCIGNNGKDADLVICKGSPMEISGVVKYLFINGELVE